MTYLNYPSTRKKGSGRYQPRVMICDDEPISVRPLMDALDAEGVHVELTERPQDCLAAARREQFDLFIIDMALGAYTVAHLRNGLELARAIWTQASPVNVPIVGITGYLPDWEERALELGLVNFLLKPLDPSEIVPDLLRLLDSRKNARQAMELWLEQTAGKRWHVVELSANRDNAVELQSNLVAGKGILTPEGPEVSLAQRVLHMGMMDRKLFEELGGRLQECLIPPQLNVGFHQHRLLSQLAQRPFRLLLRLGESGWDHLPWEFCRYTDGTDGGHWLGGDPQLTCARSAPNSGRLLDDEALPKSLKILVVGASPPGLPSLDLKSELRNLEEALVPLGQNVEWRRLGPSELDSVVGEASPETVNEHIKSFEPDIVHFICHGATSALALERDSRLALWSDYFLNLDLTGRGVKLLVLNCCLSAYPGESSPGMALGGVSAGVNAVIGHFFPVSDRAAIRFCRLLYEGLVGGAVLDAAFQEARRLVWSQELQEGRPFLPVLYVRDRFLKIDRRGSGN